LVGLEITQEHKVSTIKDLVSKRADELEVRRFQEYKTVGERSGYVKLDNKTGGLVPGDLIILAARPGMGKTAFAVGLGIVHCKVGGRVLMFSIEMPENQIADRVISSESNLNNFKIRNAELDDYDMSKIHSLDLPDNFFINDNSRLTVEKICASIRQMKIKHNLTAVIVDYLQLVKSENKNNREQEVAFISGELKRIAKECQLTVIALAQLSRKVEERPDKRPMLSDLRESGSIEQDADIVLFPFRPQYYEKIQDEIEPAEVIIAKCRNGMTVFIDAQFIGKLTKYVL
jgi:replicative DNA helicase